MNHVTKCNSCTGENLLVTGGTFMATGVTLCPEGFSLWDAKQLDTTNEVATCPDCGHTQDLFGDDLDSKERQFTVVSEDCGGEESFVDHVLATSPEGAASKVLADRGNGANVISVFEGHHMDLWIPEN